MTVNNNTDNYYYKTHIPKDVTTLLEAGAFQSLCSHLRERSDEVQNMDLMSLSGFCRNCLAKWLVLEARKLSSQMRQTAANHEEKQQIIQALDALGYDEAAAEVYGCTYPEWKKRHAKKATDEQMKLFEDSVPLHAKHDKSILQTRGEKPGTISDANINNYYKTHIPKDIAALLEAGAFQSLCSHLRERSDEVQNMDLMSLSGFCRNCLAKWLVLEARKLSSQMQQTSGVQGNKQQIIQALDALGYDEAAEEVYGCTYPEWKKRHAKKATDEQMKLFEDSAPLHAKHDKSILQTRGEKPAPINKISECKIQPTTSSQKPSSLLSNVCCQDVDGIVTTSIQSSQTENVTLIDQKQRLPVPPPSNGVNLRIGILTVSDRASANQYKTGDLSGPAVEKSILTLVDQMNRSSSPSSVINFTVNSKAIVPDDISVISQTLKQWTSACNLIFTTGGTGFAPRDVTPEATLSVLDRECDGLMTWASLECASSGEQPFAPLSRGTAGICGNSMIANLPGNPKGVEEVMQYVFPMLLHAVKDLE